VAAGDTETFVTLNNDFHAALAGIAGNAVLAELSAIVGRRARWYYRLVAPLREHESCAEHLAMVEAVESGDVEQAAKVARGHVERTRNAYHPPA
jgi:DNA-binding GntR family transcriptional regulator